MTARLMVAAVAVLSIGAGANAADPSKPDPRDSDSPTAQRDLVLASADLKSPAPVSNVPAVAPAKHRMGRVTTCRCGDEQPQTETPDAADSE